MKFKEYDVVRVLKDCSTKVKKDDEGVVVLVFSDPNEAYEVEFADCEGRTIEEIALCPEDIELAKSWKA